MSSLTSEQQLRALLQDVPCSRAIDDETTCFEQIAPPQIKKPSKEALEEAKKVTNS